MDVLQQHISIHYDYSLMKPVECPLVNSCPFEARWPKKLGALTPRTCAFRHYRKAPWKPNVSYSCTQPRNINAACHAYKNTKVSAMIIIFSMSKPPCSTMKDLLTKPWQMNYYQLFRVRLWNSGMRCMSFYILILMTNDNAYDISTLGNNISGSY